MVTHSEQIHRFTAVGGRTTVKHGRESETTGTRLCEFAITSPHAMMPPMLHVLVRAISVVIIGGYPHPASGHGFGSWNDQRSNQMKQGTRKNDEDTRF